jgi:hypothetical protein
MSADGEDRIPYADVKARIDALRPHIGARIDTPTDQIGPDSDRVLDPPGAPPDQSVEIDSPVAVAALATRIQAAGRRVTVALQLARNRARDVQPTVDAEVKTLIGSTLPPHGARRTLGHAAGDAAQALTDLTAALAEAAAIARTGRDLLARRRDLHAQVATAQDMAGIDSAEALADGIRTLHVPLVELDGLRLDADRLVPVIAASLIRRLQAAAIAARVTLVSEVTARLRQLEAQTLAVHQTLRAGPDALVDQTTAVLAVHAAIGGLPTITLPKWSAEQSKQAKGAWRAWPFDVPTIG